VPLVMRIVDDTVTLPCDEHVAPVMVPLPPLLDEEELLELLLLEELLDDDDDEEDPEFEYEQ
jgi:hypothetical protein